MHTHFRAGINLFAYYACTVTYTYADTNKLPPSLLLYYRPGLYIELVLQIHTVYLSIVSGELHT